MLQHHFWKRQRRAELKLRTIETVITLTTQFIQQWMAADGANKNIALPCNGTKTFRLLKLL
jgi:hypothetical protein